MSAGILEAASSARNCQLSSRGRIPARCVAPVPKSRGSAPPGGCRKSGTGFIDGRLPIDRETLVDTAVGIVVSLLSIAFPL
ncbi:hypothetical protein [Nocardia abscessus]|uniref:hypothetical protein n=1 Tax=Nocardia abscessus TaxID=120957 RepID=UPI001D1580C8|nr:hypothetical protein [Nocardia abscessus]MCC3330944.1 hypothetical protein [Nocardia abscessus]